MYWYPGFRVTPEVSGLLQRFPGYSRAYTYFPITHILECRQSCDARIVD